MRKKKHIWSSIFKIIFLASIIILTIVNAYSEDNLGKRLFMTNCATCHGVNGDSHGAVMSNDSIGANGKVKRTYPRDFKEGSYKYGTTQKGCLPSDSDILRIISDGIPKSFMPSFKNLSMDKKMALLAYIKKFSTRWGQPCSKQE